MELKDFKKLQIMRNMREKKEITLKTMKKKGR
jgi:hypothetical protein